MKIIVDVNLAVRWANMLSSRGIEAVHWTTAGAANAQDIEIMSYARENGYSVFTNDLDFSAILVSPRVFMFFLLHCRKMMINAKYQGFYFAFKNIGIIVKSIIFGKKPLLKPPMQVPDFML